MLLDVIGIGLKFEYKGPAFPAQTAAAAAQSNDELASY